MLSSHSRAADVAMYKGHALTLAQLESYRDRGFLLGPLKLSLCGESLGSHLCCPERYAGWACQSWMVRIWPVPGETSTTC